jgi:uncharacterized protein
VEHHSFSLKVKSVDDNGRFTGIGAVYGNVDLGGDKIMPGAFTKTLAAGKQIPLLWQHNPSDPIGSVKCTDSSQGLMVEGQLLLSDPTAQKAYQFLKAGIIKGLSIGYDTKQADFVGDVRELHELKLWELSVVTFPMNPEASVTGIKTLSDDAKAEHLAAISTHQKAIAHHSRGIAQHMKALCGVDDDEPADDADLVESESEELGMIISELKALVESAQELSE